MISMDPEKAGAELEAWAARLERQAARYTELQQRLDATSATETSPDGVVRVTVDAHGVPVELHLSDRARGMDPARVSAQLMTCLRRAQAKLAARVDDLVRATVPADEEPAKDIIANYHRRFPAPPEGVDSHGPATGAQPRFVTEEPPERTPPRPLPPSGSPTPQPAPGPAQQPAPRPGPDEDTDDWGDQSFLR
ncbi:YbaB/EbfC DNA-binding family protein [Streptoalloteichus tenebrarius]|uniref:YbaB/EbfC DNA-binding family protein n=1 Tax=Streptoalloteichus tenebrarius (strain ATCC 17920 / DSM 40477 / JCM 4838 / CBS 697.72 / NBRC 16177 / NCIMB 11028 / NRRL B-12390 / A12253. 1 / ISP 5477) TaxID=1933 RepID=A0ABT1I1C0_STRSD|nr:YbaB/EbfC family nucleoid-associated protein [Streptoalloteichus tenebrarius]MCP2261533.1 YbaB/EbfC DNA-binding family protein [Streptoalloteichus tenebrarius]BFE99307.1 hypothetical protein GCM10020241_09830 [Streptoalloteichus tenebrarius]